MIDPSPEQAQPGDIDDRQFTHASSAVRRKVSVKGSGGVSATVVVIARHGKVWMSITPPFTWEAIMEPGEVDEVIQMLGLAREDTKKLAKVGSMRARRGEAGQVSERRV